jgi:methylase of polypeptide subunit release factors
LEVGSNQSLPVIELLQKYGWLAIETNQDLQGHIRIVSAKKQKEPIE